MLGGIAINLLRTESEIIYSSPYVMELFVNIRFHLERIEQLHEAFHIDAATDRSACLCLQSIPKFALTEKDQSKGILDSSGSSEITNFFQHPHCFRKKWNFYMSPRNIGFIKEKVFYTYILNPIFILPGFHIVSDNHYFSERIRDSYKRSDLLLFLLRIRDRQG